MSFKTVVLATSVALLAISASGQFIPGQSSSYSIVSQLNQIQSILVALMTSLGPYTTGLSTAPAITADLLRINTLFISTLSQITTIVPFLMATTFTQGIAGSAAGAINAASYPGIGGAPIG